MRRLLELLANELDPISNSAGAVGLSRGGDWHCCLAGCAAATFPERIRCAASPCKSSSSWPHSNINGVCQAAHRTRGFGLVRLSNGW